MPVSFLADAGGQSLGADTDSKCCDANSSRARWFTTSSFLVVMMFLPEQPECRGVGNEPTANGIRSIANRAGHGSFPCFKRHDTDKRLLASNVVKFLPSCAHFRQRKGSNILVQQSRNQSRSDSGIATGAEPALIRFLGFPSFIRASALPSVLSGRRQSSTDGRRRTT